ncbi:MAG: dihydrofolate reductase [Thiohalocapsa sp.]|nr:dihydrofolate reductase [Thiohalocapsa sp.]
MSQTMLQDRPLVTLIAAMAHGRVIGRGNALPWRLPADLAHFKRATLDKPILMGRRTWDSLPGLLPRRRHIVISRDPGSAPADCEVARSPHAALAAAGDVAEVMVVGGASVYGALLPSADRLMLTFVDAAIDGDVHFPHWESAAWREVSREHRPRDAANPYDLDFVTLERVRAESGMS